MEPPENDFQNYRPINDPWRAVCSLERGYRWGNIQKSFLGDNFWLECPTDLRSTPLSYIFNALFRDTPLGYTFCAQPNSQIAKYPNIILWGLHTTLQVPPKDRSKIPTFFLAQATGQVPNLKRPRKQTFRFWNQIFAQVGLFYTGGIVSGCALHWLDATSVPPWTELWLVKCQLFYWFDYD